MNKELKCFIGGVGFAYFAPHMAKIGDLVLDHVKNIMIEAWFAEPEEEEEFPNKIPMGFRFDKENSKGKDEKEN